MKNGFLILFFVIVLGAGLRLVSISEVPPSLNWDEVSHGWNSYFILKTGYDEWGKLLPITNFRAYGDYPLPLNLYLTVPFVAVFGLTEFALRFPHAILGTLTIISAYFLALGLTKNKNLSILAAFMVSITPWYVFPSRGVFQSNLSVFLLTTAMATFFNREKHKWLQPLSFLCLGLTLFSYHSTRIFTPLLLVGMLILYKQEIRKSLLSIILIGLFFVPLPFILLNSEARARSNVVFLLNDGAVNKIIEQRNTSTLPDTVKRLIYNRPVYLAKEFSKNYLDYFSPQYLFLNGGTQYQFSIPNTGLLYLINLPFFYLGLLVLIKKALKNQKDYQLLLLWLLLAVVPAAITTERFAVLRSTTILPIPEILTSIGIFTSLVFLKTKKFNLVLVSAAYFVILAISVESYFANYFTKYPENYSWAWQYGYKQAVTYAKDNYNKYDKIIFTKKYGEPHEYVLFYNQWDPEKYKSDQNLVRFNQSNWWWVDRFDKYYFVNDWQIPQNGSHFVLESKIEFDCNNQKCLLIATEENHPTDWQKLDDVSFLDGKNAFSYYEN